jgi:hypothetical protein
MIHRLKWFTAAVHAYILTHVCISGKQVHFLLVAPLSNIKCVQSGQISKQVYVCSCVCRRANMAVRRSICGENVKTDKKSVVFREQKVHKSPINTICPISSISSHQPISDPIAKTLHSKSLRICRMVILVRAHVQIASQTFLVRKRRLNSTACFLHL